MGYVEDTIGTNEKIVYTVNFHWIYTFSAFLYLLFFGVFIIAVGAAYTFIINIFTGMVGKKELWSNWWDRVKTKAVVSSLIVLNILFIFNLIVFIGETFFDK